MYLVIEQHNETISGIARPEKVKRKRKLSPEDLNHVARKVNNNDSIKTGYYDVHLVSHLKNGVKVLDSVTQIK
jgi:hypothetical protein